MIAARMIWSPAKLGWTPSRRSEVGKPVLQSAMTMGDSVLLFWVAQSGMAALIWMMGLGRMESGIILST